MRFIFSLLLFAGTALGGWYAWDQNLSMPSSIPSWISSYVDNGEFLTLESRFTAEQIMKDHQKDLLGNGSRSFQDSSLKFHPYLLLDVKYISSDKKTKEGIILWSLVDGEMVINGETWEKTHGFEDAIRAKANRNDFKILNALAKHKGVLSRDQLQKELHLDHEVFDPWIESTKNKHLITQKGDTLQLHFQDPRISVAPQTYIKQWLVTKPYNHAQKIKAKYDGSQVERVAQAAFGPDFKIRNAQEIYMPVYSIDVINPDGSILTTLWNALNGQRIQPRYLIVEN